MFRSHLRHLVALSILLLKRMWRAAEAERTLRADTDSGARRCAFAQEPTSGDVGAIRAVGVNAIPGMPLNRRETGLGEENRTLRLEVNLRRSPRAGWAS
jgi:hypothetical protein